MTNPQPDTSVGPRVLLPAGQLALDAYWLVSRHVGVYAGQVLVLAAISWLVELATGIVVTLATAHMGPGLQLALLHVVYIAAIVTVLVLGGTAIFISCQRAIVLGQAPAVSHAVRLRPSEAPVLRAVCFYWLVVHLVPTVVVNGASIAAGLDLAFPRLPTAAGFAFYWGWVLATAPLVVLSLPITLFEASADPLGEGRRRLDGNTVRLFAASAIAFAPIAILDIALYALRNPSQPLDDSMALLFDTLLLPLLQSASSLLTILVMSALVASTYLRLSPRLDSVYRVFD
jgi:hypothetical protein